MLVRVFASWASTVLRSRCPTYAIHSWATRALPMISRTRFIITAALVCHLLPTFPLVTRQLLFAQNESETPKAMPPEGPPTAPSAASEEEITIRATEQEKDGPIFKLRGHAEIYYQTYVLDADEVTYNSESGDATAEGHVVLEGGPNDEHIEASRGTYNIRSQSGHFESVVGTIGLRFRRTRSILTSSNPFAFTGRVVEKTGPDHYLVYDGTVTTCELPHPKWRFSAHKVVVDVGGSAKIYRSTFRIKGVPVFYFPFATHPVERQARHSGFLIPNFGRSSRKGDIVGQSAYWDMNRSMDATIGAEYYSIRGWAQRGEFRARPSETSFLDLNYFGVLDRGIGFPPVKQGGENARLNAEGLFGHFRGVADLDYLSSFVFRLAFNEAYSQAVNSEVKSEAFLSNTTRGFSYNASSERYQNFESTQNGDVITILHAPSLEISSADRVLGHSPFYWSFDAAAEGLSRSEPSFRTAPLLGRLDINPTLSLPIFFRDWSIRPQVSLRDTLYTQRLVPNGNVGTAADELVTRKALGASVELRPPPLSRIFNREFLGRKFKHVIEPRFVYNFVTGVDNFGSVLRFDERDILSNTNELEYAVVNRLYAKRTSDKAEDCGPQGMPSLAIGGGQPRGAVPWERVQSPENQPCETQPQVREVVTWELAQKYFLDPTFGGALLSGQRNVFTTTADLTGLAFVTDARHLSPITSRLRIRSSARTDAEWDLDYDFKKGRINGSTTFLNYHFGPFTLGGGDAFLRLLGGPTSTTPAQAFNQFRVLLGYGYPNKRGLSGAGSFGFDAEAGFLQYSSVQTSYNWDCCGVSLEYRRFALGSVRNENQFRFVFSLANIAAIGNLRRQERLF